MKKSKKFALCLLPMFLLVTGCHQGETSVDSNIQESSTDKTVYVEDFTLDVTEVNLEVGGTKKITATLSPKNATKKGFTYASSDASIATVSSDGEIEGIKAGSCKITVTTKGVNKDGNHVSKEVAVTVTAPSLTALEVGAKSVIIKEEATAQITWEVKPANADRSVTFVSSDPTIATVSETGLITGVKAGETTITLTTVAKNASGEALTATVAVRVESKTIVHKVEFQNSDGSLLQAVDTIQAGEVPAFTADIPAKASDADGIYIFRGFDKEIVPYALPDDPTKPVVYKAVYEKVDCTPRKVTLTKETKDNVDSAVITLSGEAKGITTDKIKNKAYLAFSKKGGDWATTYSDAQSPVINADGSWTMQYTIDPSKFSEDTLYMCKYFWNSAEAADPVDLKLLHRATYTVTTGEGDAAKTETKDMLRYRHTAEGEVLEDNKIPDDWDGVFASNYVSDGYISDTATSQFTDSSSRQKYVDAIAAPTWVGLGLSYDEVDDLVINNKHYSFTATDETWGLPSFKIHDSRVSEITKAELVQDATTKNISYRLSGTFSGFTAADKLIVSYDLQHNSNLDGQGWGYPIPQGSSADAVIDKEPTATEAGTWHYDIELSTISDITTFADGKDNNTYTTHAAVSYQAYTQAPDFKITTFDATPIVKDGYQYRLIATSSTWNCVSLEVTQYATPITDVSFLG